MPVDHLEKRFPVAREPAGAGAGHAGELGDAARLERRHLVQTALGQRQARFYQPALASLGKQLVIWGTQLQNRNSEHYATRDIRFAPSNK